MTTDGNDILHILSRQQVARLQNLGATVTTTHVTATEEQLWRGGIIGGTRSRLLRRGALTLHAGEDAPEWVPTGAAIFADFVNGLYYYSEVGVITDPSDIFQSDEDDGDPWTPESIVPDVGYQSTGASVGLSFKASEAILVGGGTFVFEVNPGNQASLHLIAYGAPSFDVFWQATMIAGDDGCTVQVVDQVIDSGFQPPAGLFKMAVNFAADRMSASFAGRTPITTINLEGQDFITINRVTAYLQAADPAAVRTITVYPLKTDDELAALSD